MKAMITKIQEGKMSRNQDQIYYRVHLRLEDGSHAMTDIVKAYRNYQWWKPALEAGVGTWITGLFMKWKGKVDADSRVSIIKPPLPNINQSPLL
jgi:hypothetical protein